MVYLRIFQGTDRMHKRDWIAWGSWIGIALGMWVLAWIIATAIPVFSNLLTLIVRTPFPFPHIPCFNTDVRCRLPCSLVGLPMALAVSSGCS